MEVAGLGILCFVVLGGIMGIAGQVFWVWMLVDCVSNEPSEGNDKLIWALVIIFLNFLGAAIYYFVRRPQRIEQLGS